jgi:hypothetical protein
MIFMTYKIRPEREHFEVYIDGKFYCSADSWCEAENEIKNYVKGSDLNENQSA